MKRYIALALLLSSSVALPALAAKSSCTAELPKPAAYAVAYLSYLERGGTNYVEGYDRAGRTADEICIELENVDLSPSRSRPGYTQVTLEFAKESCSMDVLPGTDGRVSKSAQMTCESKAQ
jgi:hypothetical protein